LLIFTLSMDEIAVTFFLIGRDNTLPLEIWAPASRNHPEINAISTLIFAASVILIMIWFQLRTRAQRKMLEKRSFMSHSRRNFIKYVVAGSVAAGCPIDASLLAVPTRKSSTTPRVEANISKFATGARRAPIPAPRRHAQN